jgi:hypothetical protein
VPEPLLPHYNGFFVPWPRQMPEPLLPFALYEQVGAKQAAALHGLL